MSAMHKVIALAQFLVGGPHAELLPRLAHREPAPTVDLGPSPRRAKWKNSESRRSIYLKARRARKNEARKSRRK